MVDFKLDKERGILIAKPHGDLSEADFKAAEKVVDPYIKEHGKLNGIMIVAAGFPGWKDLHSFVEHIKFIKNHHRKVGKVALVADGVAAELLPSLANHFVNAEVRHFSPADISGAEIWIETD